MKPGAEIASRYTIEREIGRGGMGSVFIASDKKFGGKVALKVATAAGVTLDEFRERFAREARIGHRLGRTEGFVRALDWGEIDGTTLYLAMDLVEDARPLDLVGGTPRERLERLARAATLVATAHGLGVVHRDLKPQNFLVDRSGRIYLSDFGLAKSHGEADSTAPQITRTGLGMGTPDYMPPEQFDDARGTDERADVYALGAMLFLALTGKLPYAGTATSIMQKQVRVQGGLDRPPRPSLIEKSVPPALDDLCARALELDRAKRLADAGAFAAGLAQPESPTAPSYTPRPMPRPSAEPPPSGNVRRVAPPPPTAAQGMSFKIAAVIGCVAIVGMALLSCVVIAVFAGPTRQGVRAHVAGWNGNFAIVEGRAPSAGMTPLVVRADGPLNRTIAPFANPQPIFRGVTGADGSYRVQVPAVALQAAEVTVELGDPVFETDTVSLR